MSMSGATGYKEAVHVAIYSVHTLIVTMRNVTKPGDLDTAINVIVKMCIRDQFAAEDKENGAVKAECPEAKGNRTPEMMQHLGRIVSPAGIKLVLTPFRDVVNEHPSSKAIQRVSDLLSKFAGGLKDNEGVNDSQLLTYIFKSLTSDVQKLLEVEKKNGQKDEKEKGRRPESCLILPAAPQRIGAMAKVVIRSRDHVFAEFFVMLFSMLLKEKKFDLADDSMVSRLNPFVKLILDCFDFKYEKLISCSMRALCSMIKMQLPAISSNSQQVSDTLFVLLSDYSSIGQSGNKPAIVQLNQLIYKGFTNLIATTGSDFLDMDKLTLLLAYAEADVLDQHKQATMFSLIKALVKRGVRHERLQEIMDHLSETAIRSPLVNIRAQCRETLLDYIGGASDAEKSVEKHVEFFLDQLDYEYETGRQSAAEMLEALFKNLVATSDLSLRMTAGNNVRAMVQYAGKTLAIVEKRQYLDSYLTPTVVAFMKHDVEAVREEALNTLSVMTKGFKESQHLVELDEFSNEDEEHDFLKNMNHIQLYRRQRAIRKFVECVESGEKSISFNAMNKYLVPMIHPYLVNFSAKFNAISDESLRLLKLIMSKAPWGKYCSYLESWLALVEKSTSSNKDGEFTDKALVRIVVAVIEAFHFDVTLEDGEEFVVDDEEGEKSDKQTILQRISRVILPRLTKCLDSQTQAVERNARTAETHATALHLDIQRAPIALAIVKLLQKLPESMTTQHLHGVILKLCNLMMTHSYDVRETARKTLIQIVKCLGPKYLATVITEISLTMTKGFQVSFVFLRLRDVSKPDISKPGISKPRHLETATFRNRDISKPRHFETATFRNRDISKPRHFETATSRNRDISKPRHLETATSRNRDISKPRHFETATSRNRDISKPRHFETATFRNRDISKPRHFETATSRNRVNSGEGVEREYAKCTLHWEQSVLNGVSEMLKKIARSMTENEQRMILNVTLFCAIACKHAKKAEVNGSLLKNLRMNVCERLAEFFHAFPDRKIEKEEILVLKSDVLKCYVEEMPRVSVIQRQEGDIPVAPFAVVKLLAAICRIPSLYQLLTIKIAWRIQEEKETLRTCDTLDLLLAPLLWAGRFNLMFTHIRAGILKLSELADEPMISISQLVDCEQIETQTGVNFGTTLLSRKIKIVLDFLTNQIEKEVAETKRPAAESIILLERFSDFVSESDEVANRLATPLLICVERKKCNEETLVNMMKSLARIAPLLKNPQFYFWRMPKLFAKMEGRTLRDSLMLMIQGFVKSKLLDEKTKDVLHQLCELDAWDKTKVDEPHFERRYAAYAALTKIWNEDVPTDQVILGMLLASHFYLISTAISRM
uniref:DRIM domain-containing protein n=1 Tax=Caenorhabditis japonica TaxID=281687 RepID=A0A8R1DW73_CAEJA